MSVPAQTPVSTHVGNGATTVFAFEFLLFAAVDLQVTVDGVLKTLVTDYTVSGLDDPAGGSVTFLAAPGSGVEVSMVRRVAIKRDTDYQYSGDFQSPTVNRDFDRLVMMIQDSGLAVANAVRFPSGDTANGILPRASDRALKGLAFDADGNPILTAASGNADVLAAALLSAASPTAGGGIVGFDASKAYAGGTVGSGIKDSNAAAAAAAAAAVTVDGNLTAFKADAASLTNTAKGAALIGYKLNATNSAGRTLASKLAERVSVKDFGAVGDGITNDTLACQRALAASAGVYFPAGSYLINQALVPLPGALIFGDGSALTTIIQTTTSVPVINLSASTSFSLLGVTIKHLGTPVAGGDGVYQPFHIPRALFNDVVATNNWHGLHLSSTDYSTITNLITERNFGCGIRMTTQFMSTRGAFQWYVTNTISQLNGSHGYSLFDNQGGASTGAFVNCFTFANTGFGYIAQGSAGSPIYSVRLSNCFMGNDASGEIFLDTYSALHTISNSFLETPGIGPTGPLYATAETGVANAITLTTNNSYVAISGCAISQAAWNGISNAAPNTSIKDTTILNCGVKLAAGQRTGLDNSATTGITKIIGCTIGNSTGVTQQALGVHTTTDNLMMQGCDLNGNVTSPFTSDVGLVNSAILGNLPTSVASLHPNALNGFTSGGIVLGSGPTNFGAGTVNAALNIFKNNNVYTNP